MYGDNNSKVYVVFRDEAFEDEFDDWSLEVHWAGGSTFNIYSDGKNVDVFTRYGDDAGNPPSFEKAWESASEFLTEAREQALAIINE